MHIIGTTFTIYSSLYFLIKPYSQNNRIIISLINSSVLSIYGIYMIGQNLENPILADYVSGYFIYDLFTGHFYDRHNFQILTGYIHHTIYLALLSYIRYTNQTYLVSPFLLFEIPTAILDLKKIYPAKNLNFAFGINFLFFRLAYNIYMIKYLYQISIYYSAITTLMLIVHGYWFSIWVHRHQAKNLSII